VFWRIARARRHYPYTTLLLAAVLALAGYTIGLSRPAVGSCSARHTSPP
jgi:hypothetical protein